MTFPGIVILHQPKDYRPVRPKRRSRPTGTSAATKRADRERRDRSVGVARYPIEVRFAGRSVTPSANVTTVLPGAIRPLVTGV